MKLSNVKRYQKYWVNWLKTITEISYSYEDEKPPNYSEDGQMKYLQRTLNLMNAFLLSLLMSYVGSRFKLLRMSWYRSMKQF